MSVARVLLCFSPVLVLAEGCAGGGRTDARERPSEVPSRLTPEEALAAAQARLPLAPCQPPGVPEPVLCGNLSVPEAWGEDGGRTLELRVVVVPALARAPRPEPWIDLEGGDPATALAADYVGDLSMYRRHRDVVLVDQRGTGGSAPLRCEALDDPKMPTAPKLPPDAVRACVEAVQGNADLTRYGTEDAARDLEAVRAWLGAPRIHLYGYSYGTLLAQAYLRRHPERVATAVLWGPIAPGFQRPRFFARDTERALRGLFDACRAEPAQADGRRCGARFPEPGAAARRVLARLEEDPVRIRWRRPDRLPVTVPLTRAAFGEGLGALAYDTAVARTIPWIVDRADQGDFVPFVDAVNDRGRFLVRETTTLMYLAVTCAEETLRFRPSEADPGDAATLFDDHRRREHVAACRALPPRRVPADFFEPVETSVPVLVFSGSLDPVTPPRWGRAVTERMTNARPVVIDGMGHTVEGMTDPTCPDRIANALADSETLATLDLGCAAAMRPPPFHLGPPGR